MNQAIQSPIKRHLKNLWLIIAYFAVFTSHQAQAMDDEPRTPTEEDRLRHELQRINYFDTSTLPRAFQDLADFQSETENKYEQLVSLGMNLWRPHNTTYAWSILSGSAALSFWAYHYGLSAELRQINDLDVILATPLSDAQRFFPTNFISTEGTYGDSGASTVTVLGAKNYFDTSFISSKGGICNSGPSDLGSIKGIRQPVLSPSQLLKHKRAHFHQILPETVKAEEARHDIALLEKIVAQYDENQ